VAHACNPSYSGGRDQEDHGLKPAQANSSRDPISEKTFTERAGGVARGVGPEFKPQYCKKKKDFNWAGTKIFDCSLPLAKVQLLCIGIQGLSQNHLQLK
jgi:hypothetical protein